jgi:hypothetical protein
MTVRLQPPKVRLDQGVTTETCSYVGKVSDLKTECEGLFTTTL